MDTAIFDLFNDDSSETNRVVVLRDEADRHEPDSPSGTLLHGATIGADGAWPAQPSATLAICGSTLTHSIAPASAVPSSDMPGALMGFLRGGSGGSRNR